MSLTKEPAQAPEDPVALLEHARQILAHTVLPLELAGVAETRTAIEQSIAQLEDYILPRYRSLDAPLLAVVGGSTGAGKSTLVNALAGRPVTRAGAIRPTTRQPLLLHNPADQKWFADARVLPGLSRIIGRSAAADGTDLPANQSGTDLPANQSGADPNSTVSSLVLLAEESIPSGLAVLDAPDIDSISAPNRKLAGQLLAAADLWLFVTTANRYADAVPWKLLSEAAGRDILLAVVLDRVPEGVQDEVRDDLLALLTKEGLAEAKLFLIPELPLDELGMLPPEPVAPVRDWLQELAVDAAGRADISRRTLHGAVRALASRVEEIAAADAAQREAAVRLSNDVREAYDAAAARVLDSTQDGALLRGEVLARWQDFVGTGDFFRAVESNIGRLRDRIGSFFRAQPAPAVQVETAIESGLQAVIVDEAAKAAEETDRRWRADPGGRQLLGADDLATNGPDLPDRVAAEIRAWQGELLDLIRTEGQDKRLKARVLSFGINGLGVALMVVVFASTAGLTGLEVGIAGGSAIAGQKLLEAIFGEDAVRRLAATARTNLQRRCEAVLASEAQRFLVRLNPEQVEQPETLSVLAKSLKRLAESA